MLIYNRFLYDGSGHKPFKGDVGIRADRVVAVGKWINAKAAIIADKAILDNPVQYPVGVEHVLIKGKQVLKAGAFRVFFRGGHSGGRGRDSLPFCWGLVTMAYIFLFYNSMNRFSLRITSQLNGHTEIRVKDNGTGIPNLVKAKIFQPFFTTKPTGEGTGLGLSLSYDIITKGHGGTLTLESSQEAGTTFTITLLLKP